MEVAVDNSSSVISETRKRPATSQIDVKNGGDKKEEEESDDDFEIIEMPPTAKKLKLDEAG